MILNRCKDTLRKFLADEKKAAYMISQTWIDEVVFIFESLKDLDVYPDLIPQII